MLVFQGMEYKEGTSFDTNRIIFVKSHLPFSLCFTFDVKTKQNKAYYYSAAFALYATLF